MCVSLLFSVIYVPKTILAYIFEINKDRDIVLIEFYSSFFRIQKRDDNNIAIDSQRLNCH